MRSAFAIGLALALSACCLTTVSGDDLDQATSAGSSSGGSMTGASGSPFSGVTVVATGQSGACGLCLDSNNLYWQTTNAISKLPLGGGDSTVLAGELRSPAEVACDGTNVYWNDNQAFTISAVSIDGGTPNQLATSPDLPMAIAVQNGQVFWGTMDGNLFAGSQRRWQPQPASRG